MLITSARNPRIKYILGLIERRSSRNKSKQFFVEGVRAINSIRAHGWQIDTLIYCPENVQSQWAREIIAKIPERIHLPVNTYLQERLSQRSAPSELMAVVSQEADDLARIVLSPRLLVVLVDRPQNPGNLGSLIRSCDSLGVDGLLISGHAVDLYSPRTVRASMGSFFALPVIRLDALQMLEMWIGQVCAQYKDFQIVGTSAHADCMLFEHDLTYPTLLVLGNEMRGMSHYFTELCDINLTIPMFGTSSSLNMAAAASILLYEINRQRLAVPGL